MATPARSATSRMLGRRASCSSTWVPPCRLHQRGNDTATADYRSERPPQRRRVARLDTRRAIPVAFLETIPVRKPRLGEEINGNERSGQAGRRRSRTMRRVDSPFESIELIPLVVPLGREYRGSHYRMNNRASIVTRIHTAEGIVGEAYAGDEDKTLGEIASVIRDEIAPQLIGQNAFAYERCWELGLPGHLRPAARPPHRPGRARQRRLRDLGRHRQGHRPAALAGLGRLPRSHAGQHHRRLLRARRRGHQGRDRRLEGRWGSAAASSRSAVSAPSRTRRASPRRARPPARTS